MPNILLNVPYAFPHKCLVCDTETMFYATRDDEGSGSTIEPGSYNPDLAALCEIHMTEEIAKHFIFPNS